MPQGDMLEGLAHDGQNPLPCIWCSVFWTIFFN